MYYDDMPKPPKENPIDIFGCQVKHHLTGFKLQMELLRCDPGTATWGDRSDLREIA